MNDKKPSPKSTKPSSDAQNHKEEAKKLNDANKEYGGQEGPDPTRYGDWEKGGRCTDF